MCSLAPSNSCSTTIELPSVCTGVPLEYTSSVAHQETTAKPSSNITTLGPSFGGFLCILFTKVERGGRCSEWHPSNSSHFFIACLMCSLQTLMFWLRGRFFRPMQSIHTFGMALFFSRMQKKKGFSPYMNCSSTQGDRRSAIF